MWQGSFSMSNSMLIKSVCPLPDTTLAWLSLGRVAVEPWQIDRRDRPSASSVLRTNVTHSVGPSHGHASNIEWPVSLACAQLLGVQLFPLNPRERCFFGCDVTITPVLCTWLVIQLTLTNLNTFPTSHFLSSSFSKAACRQFSPIHMPPFQRDGGYLFTRLVCFWAGYLKRLWPNLDETRWTAWLGEEDELIRFWWRFRSGSSLSLSVRYKT